MKNKLRRAAMIGLLISVLPAAAGCEAVHTFWGKEPAGSSANQAQSDGNAQPSPSGAAGQTPVPDRPAAVSSNENTEGPVKAKPVVTPENTYRASNPALMGVTLGTPKDEVLNLFGKAKNMFVMDEDPQSVTVYEYGSFSVGFNVFDRLEFVQIQSADIDPGLGGLRLGQSADEAANVLGKPDNRTDYVLTYKARNTVLKLDLDPESHVIQSIKLFPAS
ncbi:hypothetical protein [Paenibacillus sp. 1P03SA]|uniref:hypothetical protein n=1 Tax=Paenibacillus sp. 1P03SA TaxID=3132294 RepID=UPI0039A2E26D